MKSSRLAGALWIVLSAIVFAGCGGGGGGHIAGSNDGNGGGGGDGGGGGGDLGGLTGVEFTEDTSLDEDLSGNWIMISELDDEPQTSAIPTTFSGIRRQSFYMNASSGLSIGSCVGANNVVETETTVTFEFNNTNYELHKDSNTHLSGSSESAVDGSAIGQITMIKTGERSDILGLFTYAVDGETADPFGVVCYSDRHGIETSTQDGRTSSVEVESFEASNFSSTSIGTVSVTRHLDEDFYTLDVITSTVSFSADISDEGSVIEVDIGGTNDISLEINAVDGASDGSTFEGSVELEL